MLTVDAGDGDRCRSCAARPTPAPEWSACSARPGAYIPGSDMTLKVAAIRGVESRGMMCSARELELGEDHAGIIELAADAPVGDALRRYAGLDDPVFDVHITPNRQDCMGVRGIARDLAAAGMGTFKPLAVPQIEGSFPCPVPVTIEDPEGCPAFFGRAITRPHERQLARLAAAPAQGRRPAADLGAGRHHQLCDARPRPAGHAYDIAKLKGGLTARAAQARREGARAQREGICARAIR